eukprot:TRINITY_DN5559_c0_g1_i4.p1 TRINITY_DN5559_c0_g1~~TRINITY_DN5559_c0_g1_i4.p1  ORF type:complete len:232 (-),score=52.52 TRINITY_DN5559_c0_g1_i4:125-820(-)
MKIGSQPFQLAKLLVQHGAPMNLKTAILIEDMEYLTSTIQNYGIDYIYPELQQTMVQYVTQWEEIDSTRILDSILKFNPDVGKTEKEPRSALEIAASLGKKCHVQALLNYMGASVLSTPTQALYNAVSYGCYEAVDLLLSAQLPVHPEALFIATRKKNFRILELLFKKGANPSVVNEENNSLLHIASATGDLDLVQLIVSAHVNYQNKNVKSCWQLAEGNVEISDFLSSLC